MSEESVFWIHGVATVPEYTKHLTGHDNGLYFRPTGFGAKASQSAGTDNWFHLAIPTPNPIANHYQQPVEYYLTFKISAGAYVRRIHIRHFDAPFKNCIISWDSGDLNITNTDIPKYTISHQSAGYGPQVICMYLYFEAANAEIWFMGAGIRFRYP